MCVNAYKCNIQVYGFAPQSQLLAQCGVIAVVVTSARVKCKQSDNNSLICLPQMCLHTSVCVCV